MEQVRRSAGTLAAAGRWVEVSALLGTYASDVRGEFDLANLRGEALLRTGHSRDADAWLELAARDIERRGDRAALRRATVLRGAARFDLGNLDAARADFERAMRLGREDDDHLLVARATNNLGAIANVRGERDEALARYRIAVAAYQRLGHALGLAESYHNMAITFRDLGQLDRADECERRAIEFAREAGSARLGALALMGRAEVSLRRGDARMAEATARRAAADFAAIPDPGQQGDAFRVIGLAAMQQDRLDEAREALERALALAQAHGPLVIEAETLRAQAELAACEGDEAALRAKADAALAAYTQLGAEAERAALAAWLAGVTHRRRRADADHPSSPSPTGRRR